MPTVKEVVVAGCLSIASLLRPIPARAACNIIPSATGSFRSTLGSPLRPFAAPDETVELRVRQEICDGASPGFSATPANHVVTVVFTPPNGGARNVVALAADCVALEPARAACEDSPDGTGTNYMVHASRRDAAGQAEMHLRDTDVIYMLEGATTFVTGGTVVEGKTTAPDEIRGVAIEGGDTRRLAKGDVMIVPNGTPHWFKDVDGPVLYYVVKVR